MSDRTELDKLYERFNMVNSAIRQIKLSKYNNPSKKAELATLEKEYRDLEEQIRPLQLKQSIHSRKAREMMGGMI